MTLRQIIRRYCLERDKFYARVHGRIVGASDGGFDDEQMPEWVREHRAPSVKQAWWSGFAAGGEWWISRQHKSQN